MVKPYYQDDAVTIFCGDCREIVPGLGRFDLLLTDPPYGLGNRMQGGTWGGSAKYDKMREWDTEAPDLGFLLVLGIPAIVWGGNYFALPPSRCWLSWSKTNVVQTMASMELAWTNFDKPAKEWRGKVGTHDTGHPTQKPLALMNWCIGLAGDVQTILDPFAGSGTTAVAAKSLGRKCVCVEREERYCEIAAKRCAQEILPLYADNAVDRMAQGVLPLGESAPHWAVSGVRSRAHAGRGRGGTAGRVRRQPDAYGANPRGVGREELGVLVQGHK